MNCNPKDRHFKKSAHLSGFSVYNLIILLSTLGCSLPITNDSLTTAQDTPLNPPRKPQGIYKNSTGFLDSTVENEWRGIIDGSYFIIYAGARMESIDPNQGLVIVTTEINKQREIPNDSYFTPSKHGSAKIIKEENGKLTLQTNDGTSFIFDIRTRSFLKQEKEIATEQKYNCTEGKMLPDSWLGKYEMLEAVDDNNIGSVDFMSTKNKSSGGSVFAIGIWPKAMWDSQGEFVVIQSSFILN